MQQGSLFVGIPEDLPEELVDTLLSNNDVRVERIVSRGHQSRTDFWYDQDEDEFVLVVQGAARIALEDEVVFLKPGDWLHLPAHCKHRVAWTVPNEDTIWLAFFWQPTVE